MGEMELTRRSNGNYCVSRRCEGWLARDARTAQCSVVLGVAQNCSNTMSPNVKTIATAKARK